MPDGTRIQAWRRRAVVLGCVAVPLWLICFARWPKHQIAEATIHPPERDPLVIELWASEAVVALPFFDGDKKFVRCGRHQRMLHGSGFGYNAGRIAVSPDFKQAVVYHSFEGGQFPSIFVDLVTGELRPVPPDNYFTNYESLGWSPQKWTVLNRK